MRQHISIQVPRSFMSIVTPHDRFFRETFGRREIAADFLREYLPPEIRAEVDLERLTIAKDTYVTIEQGRQEGWQQGQQEGWQKGQREGWQKGRLEGKQEGQQEGEAAVLLRLLERKFGPPSETVRQRIAQADSETLLVWAERVLTADSVEALFH